MCLSQPLAALAAIQPPQTEKKVTVYDVQKVHALIESCLYYNMTQEETCDALARMGVDRRFTSLVWERLEQENPEYFAEYNAKLETMVRLHRLDLGGSWA